MTDRSLLKMPILEFRPDIGAILAWSLELPEKGIGKSWNSMGQTWLWKIYWTSAYRKFGIGSWKENKKKAGSLIILVMIQNRKVRGNHSVRWEMVILQLGELWKRSLPRWTLTILEPISQDYIIDWNLISEAGLYQMRIS